jgi:hypothetical protein
LLGIVHFPFFIRVIVAGMAAAASTVANAASPRVATFAREVQHDGDGTWNSTHKKLWDQVMRPVSLHFDNIGLSDLRHENSAKVISEFVSRCVSEPPISRHTKTAFKVSTLQDCMSAVINKLKLKFGSQLSNNEADLFSEDDVTKMKKKLRDQHRRVMMEGADDSDLLKDTFPLPRVHSPRTALFESKDFPSMRTAGRNTDMRSVCRYLFKMERFSELSKVITTFNGIGRAGEAKFLSYRSMMMDMTYGFLFVQWFQRKSLKTNPSGFVPEWEFPEMCMFLALGCYWAFCDGLYRPGGAKLPSTPVQYPVFRCNP